MVCQCPVCGGYNIYFTILPERALNGHIFEALNLGSEPLESIGHSLQIFYCRDCTSVISPVSLIQADTPLQNKS